MNRIISGGLALFLSASVSAQTFTTSGVVFPDTNTGYTLRGGPTSITQNTDIATITALNSVACPADNDSYFRRFDLDTDHAIIGNFDVTDVDFAIETLTGVGGTQDIIVNLHSIANADAFLLANLTQIGTVTLSIADGLAFIQNAVVTGSLDGSTDDLVVEVVANDTTNGTAFFIGSNAAGQTAPSFILSAGCGATEPTDIAGLGFPGMHIVMVVNGNVGPLEADLTVGVSNNAIQPVSIGDQFDYTITATNNGPAAATGVTVIDTLSSNVTYISNTCGAVNAANMVTWSVGNLASAANASCDVTVEVNGFGNISNSATINGNEVDPVAGNNVTSNAVAGPAQNIPSLSLIGLLVLVAGMLLVYRRTSFQH